MLRTSLLAFVIALLAACSTQTEPTAWSRHSSEDGLANGIAADAILGQLDERAGNSRRTDAGSFSTASGVAAGGGHLWVADTGNRRVLGWVDVSSLSSGSQNGTEADVVLLQPNEFVTDHRNIPTAPIAHNFAPTGVEVDDSDRLYVHDGANVIVFEDPYSDDRVADYQLTGEPAGIVSVRALGNNKLAVVGNSQVVIYEQGSPDPYGQSTMPSPCGVSLTDIAEAGSAYLLSCRTGVTCSTGLPPPTTCGGIFAYEIDGSTGLPEQPLIPYTAYTDFGPVSSIQTMADFLLIAENGLHRIAHFSGTASHAAGVITAAGAARLPGDTTTFYGQPDAFSGSPNASTAPQVISADGFDNPTRLSIDSSDQRMWVVDANNYRVLGFNAVGGGTPTELAQIVLGQPDMSHSLPNRLEASSFFAVNGMALGTSGGVRGVVADRSGHRVLVFDNVDMAATGAAPAHVIGQPSGEDYDVNAFSTPGLVGARDLNDPTHAYVDGTGTVWVNDFGNNRILAYEALGSSQAATRAYGATSTNNAGTVFFDMAGFAVTSTHLFVAAGNRVLMYEIANPGEAPARVFGQEQPDSATPTVVANACNRGGVRADSLCGVTDVEVDGDGTLWVADASNNRILWFENPTATDVTAAITADGVVGQPDFVSNIDFASLGRGPWGFANVQAISIDGNGVLWLADSNDSRVLAFFDPKTPDATTGLPHAGLVLGQTSFTAAGANSDPNGRNARTLSNPTGVAVSPDGRVVLVADTGNSRVLRYVDNDPPSLDQAGLYQVQRGASLTVALSATDPDGDPVTITPVMPLANGIAADGSNVTYTAAPETPVGTRAVASFALADGGPRPQFATASVIFEVIERAEPATTGTAPAPRPPREPGSGCSANDVGALPALFALLPLILRRRRR